MFPPLVNYVPILVSVRKADSLKKKRLANKGFLFSILSLIIEFNEMKIL